MGFNLLKSHPFTAIANVAGGSIGNFLNDVTGVNSQMDKSYKQQKATMALQNQYNKDMWNLQNEYNSPSAQLARMADAGIEINPTSYALGTGNLSNTATFVGSESGFSGSGSPAGNPISMLMGMAQGIQGIRESKARTENMYEQNNNLQEVTNATSLENQIRRHNLKIAKKTGTPVGNMPTWDSVVGQELAGLRDNPGKIAEKFVPGYKPAKWLTEKIRSWF